MVRVLKQCQDPDSYRLQPGETQTLTYGLLQLLTPLFADNDVFLKILEKALREGKKHVVLTVILASGVMITIHEQDAHIDLREVEIDFFWIFSSHCVMNFGKIPARVGVTKQRRLPKPEKDPYDDIDLSAADKCEKEDLDAEDDVEMDDDGADVEMEVDPVAQVVEEMGFGTLRRADGVLPEAGAQDEAELEEGETAEAGEEATSGADSPNMETVAERDLRNGRLGKLKELMSKIYGDIIQPFESVLDLHPDDILAGSLTSTLELLKINYKKSVASNTLPELTAIVRQEIKLALPNLTGAKRNKVVKRLLDEFTYPGRVPADFNRCDMPWTGPSDLPWTGPGTFVDFPLPAPLPETITVDSIFAWFDNYDPPQHATYINRYAAPEYFVDRLSDRVAYAAHRSSLIDLITAARSRLSEHGGDSQKDWTEAIETLEAPLARFERGLQPDRDRRTLAVRLSPDEMAALKPLVERFYNNLPKTKALISVVDNHTDAASYPKPQPAKACFSWDARTKQLAEQARRKEDRGKPKGHDHDDHAEHEQDHDDEEEIEDFVPLASLLPVVEPRTKEERQRQAWLAGPFGPDAFKNQPLEVQEHWNLKAKENWIKYGRMEKLRCRNEPFVFERYDGCYGRKMDEYHARIAKRPVYKPGKWESTSDEDLQGIIALRAQTKDPESVGFAPLDPAPFHEKNAFRFRNRIWLLELADKIKARNADILRQAAEAEAAAATATAAADMPANPTTAPLPSVPLASPSPSQENGTGTTNSGNSPAAPPPPPPTPAVISTVEELLSTLLEVVPVPEDGDCFPRCVSLGTIGWQQMESPTSVADIRAMVAERWKAEVTMQIDEGGTDVLAVDLARWQERLAPNKPPLDTEVPDDLALCWLEGVDVNNLGAIAEKMKKHRGNSRGDELVFFFDNFAVASTASRLGICILVVQFRGDDDFVTQDSCFLVGDPSLPVLAVTNKGNRHYNLLRPTFPRSNAAMLGSYLFSLGDYEAAGGVYSVSFPRLSTPTHLSPTSLETPDRVPCNPSMSWSKKKKQDTPTSDKIKNKTHQHVHGKVVPRPSFLESKVNRIRRRAEKRGSGDVGSTMDEGSPMDIDAEALPGVADDEPVLGEEGQGRAQPLDENKDGEQSAVDVEMTDDVGSAKASDQAPDQPDKVTADTAKSTPKAKTPQPMGFKKLGAILSQVNFTMTFLTITLEALRDLLSK